MKRVVVVGAGFFGRHVARRLVASGVGPLVAARRGGDVRMDAEDEASLRAVLRRGDVVVDTAGPFSLRTPRLVRVATEIGCDVVDLAERLAWTEAVLALRDRITAAGVSVYPACSAIAAVSGACVVASELVPRSVDQYLAPASRETASPAAVAGLIGSLGCPIRTLRDGRIETVSGYVESDRFPGSRRRGGVVESAATVLLPLSWPTLRRVDFWVDPNMPLARRTLGIAARVGVLAAAARWLAPRVPPLGRRDGLFAVRVRDTVREVSITLSAPTGSYLVAVEPAVMVAHRLAHGATAHAGIALPHEQIDPDALFGRLRSLRVDVTRVG